MLYMDILEYILKKVLPFRCEVSWKIYRIANAPKMAKTVGDDLVKSGLLKWIWGVFNYYFW